jgi:N-terminal 7TM region of histidine kinase
LIGGWGIRMSVRTARRVAGCAAVGSVVLTGGGLVLAYVDRHVPASLTGWTVSNVSQQVVNAAVAVIGFVLASRRPENRIGWLFLVAGLLLSVSTFSGQYGLHALVADPGSWPAGRAFAWLSNWLSLIPAVILAFLLLLFPTGYVRSRRWRPAAWFVGGVLGFITVWLLIAATSLWAHPFTSGQGSGVIGLLFLMTAVLLSAALLVGVAALAVRFVKSSGEERLQLKWCAAAALVLVVVFVASIWVNSAAVNVLQSVAFVWLWTAIAVAVLKYRLYDIDRIISRTLAYAIVTGLLVGVYAGLVLLATQVLAIKSPVAVASSTLVAAALFSPLRSRVQRAVDHRFNRARYDADQTMAAFAARLKDAVDLDSVRNDLAEVVDRVLEPAHISVWVSQQR